MPDEIDAVDLPVEGTLPPELDGRYVRNGPNPLPGADPGHWFRGHGMLHGVRLGRGRALWYRNRWVRTGALAGRRYLSWRGVDLTAVPANTHVIEHGGRLLALVEQGLPYEVDRDLGTVGPCDFGGRLRTAMTAHPKADPVTGELHFYGYSPVPPFLTYHRLSAAGELVVSRRVSVRRPTLMHDAAITARHTVWLDLPLTFSLRHIRAGFPFVWDESYGARLGVMRHDDPTATVRWFEIDPCYVFHVGTAHEDADGRIVVDGSRYDAADMAAQWAPPTRRRRRGRARDTAPEAARDAAGAAGADPAGRAAGTGAARMHRWVLDPATGRVSEGPLDDRPVEFPTVDPERVGRAARYRYGVTSSRAANAILKLDLTTGRTLVHELGPEVKAGEAVFVPAARADRGEDDGWLLTITTRADGSASRLLVLDATDVTRTVAAVTLPRGVPSGFHGSWIPEPPEG
ncbi:carotenoid oxygenase family protein [Actinomycetospora straminea]|uniref:Dioxygenase n=1 Tax=Actinomycetospora straminea TaxID=663607 RepID=A0ABP9EAW0_9PSEU|nr:carotenoid oxygenase family protein [Actinomycetospora straminea]MDD7935347.1 carotenoid oxygenase family protein [Actinomycetospora straminea]